MRAGRPRKAWTGGWGGAVLVAVALTLVWGVGARRAGAAATSPLGAYPGETVRFGQDPAQGLQLGQCQAVTGGPTLLMSNDPEEIPGPGILYQDTVSGSVRIFLYHVNVSPHPLHVGILMTNPGSAAVTVYVDRQGIAGPSPYYLATGKLAEHLWLERSREASYVLLGHHSWFLAAPLVRVAVPPHQAVAAIIDLLATGPVTFTTVAELRPSLSLAGLAVLPSLSINAAGSPMRGTFPGADLTCTGTIFMPVSGRVGITFGAGRRYIDGRSAVDGNIPVVDYGNYGVFYRVHLTVWANLASPWSHFALLLHPDNYFAGMAVLALPGASPDTVIPLPVDQPAIGDIRQAVMLETLGIHGLTPVSMRVDWMTAAGSSLPVQLLLYPVY